MGSTVMQILSIVQQRVLTAVNCCGSSAPPSSCTSRFVMQSLSEQLSNTRSAFTGTMMLSSFIMDSSRYRLGTLRSLTAFYSREAEYVSGVLVNRVELL